APAGARSPRCARCPRYRTPGRGWARAGSPTAGRRAPLPSSPTRHGRTSWVEVMQAGFHKRLAGSGDAGGRQGLSPAGDTRRPLITNEARSAPGSRMQSVHGCGTTMALAIRYETGAGAGRVAPDLRPFDDRFASL